MKKRAWLKKIFWTILTLFIIANIIAAFQAYSFTHFSDSANGRTPMERQGFWSQASTLLTGVNNPKPINHIFPDIPYQTITIDGDYPTECWLIKADSSIGTVIVCHGYGGCKSTMLDKANEFLAMNYSVLLLDFMGSGGSPGNCCTIGFNESQQVKSCTQYLSVHGEKNVILFGTSTGAVAIMKSLGEDSLKVSAAILECPFGSMYATTCARFNILEIPSFPMAGLLVFWGGVENGFWAFGHNPTEYAKTIHVPVLLMYGEKDEKVSRKEIDEIYSNISSTKKLITFAQAGHENYLTQYGIPWRKAVTEFLGSRVPKFE
jgi:pimeloyl-ACP methyl ester carboxylesterase